MYDTDLGYTSEAAEAVEVGSEINNNNNNNNNNDDNNSLLFSEERREFRFEVDASHGQLVDVSTRQRNCRC